MGDKEALFAYLLLKMIAEMARNVPEMAKILAQDPDIKASDLYPTPEEDIGKKPV